MFNKISEVLEFIQNNEVMFVDFKFTDFLGRARHVSRYAQSLTKKDFEEGIQFDYFMFLPGSACGGMNLSLKPIFHTAFPSPFPNHNTVAFLCQVYDKDSKQVMSHDCREVSVRAANHLTSSGIADNTIMEVSSECFVFDNVQYDTNNQESYFSTTYKENPYSNENKDSLGNYGFKILPSESRFRDLPMDSLHNIRAEILENLKIVGINPVMHSKGLYPAQVMFTYEGADLVGFGDKFQMYKYTVRNVVSTYGKTTTFMPKPIADGLGSGLRIRQKLIKSGKNLLADKGDVLQQYIAGVVKHIGAICAFTNASNNSYKRLSSFSDDTPAIRVDLDISGDTVIEYIFPDAVCNPYYVSAAILMAGMDGIKNKITTSKQLTFANLPKSLTEALSHLANDQQFLQEGGVFNEQLIGYYIKSKQATADEGRTIPTATEFTESYNF